MRSIFKLAIAVAVLSACAQSSSASEPMIFHATESGKQALDQGEGGGNPFASALIDILRRPRAGVVELPAELKRLTLQKSSGFQSADGPGNKPSITWSIVPSPVGERRIALVLVVSDYSRTGGAPSLPGAKHDAQRIAETLKQAGFVTEIALDLSLNEMHVRLARFAQQSESQDASIIYTTGHGVEVNNKVFLLPGDYPIAERNAALPQRALELETIARSARAKRINLVFYGGCRDDPLAN